MGSDYNTAGGQAPSVVLNQWRSVLPQVAQLLGSQTSGVSQSGLTALNQLYNPANVNDALATAKGNASQAQTALTAAQQAFNKHPSEANRLALQQAQAAAKLDNSAVTTAQSNAAQGQNLGINQLNAQQAQQFAQNVNPNYTTAQTAASKGAANAVGAINLNGLSPGESNAVERSLNQTNTATGNMGLINPTNTISNAINFGGAFNSKIGLMNNATNAASGAANSATSMGGFTPVNAQTLQGQSQQNAFGSGTNIFGSMTGGNNAAQGAGATMAGQTAPTAYLNSTLGNL